MSLALLLFALSEAQVVRRVVNTPAPVFVVEIVRGSVHASAAERTDAIIAAHRTARTSQAAALEFVVEENEQQAEVYSRYPTYTRDGKECLPPLDRREDFFHHDGRLDVAITVPLRSEVRVAIQETGVSATCHLSGRGGT